MPYCSKCYKDRPGGRVNPVTGDFECGGCNPDYSVAKDVGRGTHNPFRQRRR